MAWGRSTPKPPPPPRSVLMTLLPLILLLIVVLVVSYIAYHLYTSMLSIQQAATTKLQAKNINFTKEGGLRVGVREVSTEKYVDATRDGFVKAWNLSEWPGYRSRFWNQAIKEKGKGKEREVKRPREMSAK